MSKKEHLEDNLTAAELEVLVEQEDKINDVKIPTGHELAKIQNSYVQKCQRIEEDYDFDEPLRKIKNILPHVVTIDIFETEVPKYKKMDWKVAGELKALEYNIKTHKLEKLVTMYIPRYLYEAWRQAKCLAEVNKIDRNDNVKRNLRDGDISYDEISINVNNDMPDLFLQ